MFDNVRFRLRALFDRRQEESDLNDELRFHFEKQVEKLRRSGMSEAEARRQARLIFGTHEQVKEDIRDARGTSFVENARQDLRYAARQLRQPHLRRRHPPHARAQHRRQQRHLQRY